MRGYKRRLAAFMFCPLEKPECGVKTVDARFLQPSSALGREGIHLALEIIRQKQSLNICISVPSVLIFFFGQRQIVRGRDVIVSRVLD